MQNRLKILGYFSITFGLIAALLSILPFFINLPFGIFIAIFSGFIGLIISTIYIFIDTKHEINTSKFTVGVMGMILSSTPILIMISIIVLSKINS